MTTRKPLTKRKAATKRRAPAKRKAARKHRAPKAPQQLALPEVCPTNADIATELDNVADLLDIQGDNPFKIRAYRNAARMIRGHVEPLSEMLARGDDLTKLPHIGKDMAAYILELCMTGHLKRLEDLEKSAPPSLVELMHLPGLGPKRAQLLWKRLGITSLVALEAAARAGKIAKLPRFGAKTEQAILESLAQKKSYGGRFRLFEAEQQVQPLVAYLNKHAAVEKLTVAGSFRRRKETVGDIDLLVVSDKPEAVMDHFVAYPRAATVRAKGTTRSTIVLQSGLQVDLRVLPQKSFGAALLYFTGSKEHNIRLRTRAEKQGLRISEYGVFKAKKAAPRAAPAPMHEPKDPWAGKWVAGKTEREVYAAVGLNWIPPEIREDRGEIAAAEAGTLPNLVTLEDIRGDLQMHTTWSDGKNTVEEMIAACADRGYEYMAITDHSPALRMVRGLNPERLQEQLAEIKNVASRYPHITLLRSMEVDIHADGKLDMPDRCLETLDLVVVSVHSHLKLSSKEQTRRVLTGIKHPRANILAHPTGRIINERAPMSLNMDEVLKCAADHNVAMELNAQPDRLDLNDQHLFRARELGVKIVISTDAHAIDHLACMRYGVDQARRGWLTTRDVLNTQPLDKLTNALRK
ncbi:MAG: DNA polymerase/3'-5' exonuclease PolX [Candidatus Hydrogenedentales bacterium]